MKRPKATILIAAWLFFALIVIWGSVNRSLGIPVGRPTVENNYELWHHWVRTFGFVLVVWEVASFFALRIVARWIAVCIFSYWSFVLLWNGFFTFWMLNTIGLFFLIFASVSLTLNGLCIWYLTRRKFRDFSVEYVRVRRQEKYSRDMRKAAEKKLRNELGKH